jgi:hypothetical protein
MSFLEDLNQEPRSSQPQVNARGKQESNPEALQLFRLLQCQNSESDTPGCNGSCDATPAWSMSEEIQKIAID